MNHEIFALCDHIRNAGFALHRHPRHGRLEKVYENGLASRIRKMNLPVVQQHPLNVFDEDGTLLGDFHADLFVDQRLIVELKACRALADQHLAQLLGYLRASPVEHDLSINFGSPRLGIRKFVLSSG